MFHQLTNAQLLITVAVLIVVVIVVGDYFRRRKAKTSVLRNRFGTEYDHAVRVHGSSETAEANLAFRENRVHAMKIHELDAAERERFVAQWQILQSRFVDHPEASVTEADDLIAALLEAKGYPKENFDDRAADLSVLHPRAMENYRAAHAIAVRPYRGETSTETLRTALTQYHAIFDEILQPDFLHQQGSVA
jgi:hypothetical protein